MNPTQDDVDEIRRKVERLRIEANDLEEEADELQEEVDDLADNDDDDIDRICDYKDFIAEIREHKDIPEFQKLLMDEKLDNGTITGSLLRQCYQSGGMMPPTDLIGLP